MITTQELDELLVDWLHGVKTICNKLKVIAYRENGRWKRDKKKFRPYYRFCDQGIRKVIYETGKTTKPHAFIERYTRYCSPGLHVFIRKSSAIRY